MTTMNTINMNNTFDNAFGKFADLNYFDDMYDSDHSITSNSNKSDHSDHSTGSDFTNSTGSNSTMCSDCTTDSDNSIYKLRTRKKFRQTNLQDSYTQYNVDANKCAPQTKNLGYTSDLTKDSPFIAYLIEKRTKFCQLGSSTHISAFVSVSSNSRSCFKRGKLWKSRYR